jgi:hypothetical protein
LPGTAADAKLPRVARSTLHPDIRASSRRDPFSAAPAAAEKSSFVPFAAMSRLLNKLREDRQWLFNRPTAEGPGSLAAHTAPAPAALGQTLTLHATYLHPNERLAVIDNRIYAEGDRVAVAGGAAKPCTLDRVERDRVVLHYRGETVVLTYPQPTRQSPRAALLSESPTSPNTPRADLEAIQQDLLQTIEG